MAKDVHNQKTKEKLEDIALHLFVQHGYDKTSISSIIEKAQVSKGAFYHYFQSKEEVLDSVLDQYGQRVGQIVNEVVQLKDLSGLEKFNLAFAKIQEYKEQNIDRLLKIGRVWQADQDNKFESKFIGKIIDSVNKPFTQIIKQGVKEGDFKTNYPEEIIGAIMYLGIYIKESTKEFIFNPKKALLHLNVLIRKYNFIQDALAGLLGAKKGAIKLSTKSIKDIYKIIGKRLNNQ